MSEESIAANNELFARLRSVETVVDMFLIFTNKHELTPHFPWYLDAFPNACTPCSCVGLETTSEHDYPYTTTLLVIHIILRIDTSSNRTRSVVEEIVVQLTIARPKFLLFKEQWVVQERQRVEDVEIELWSCERRYEKRIKSVYLLSQDQSIIHKTIQSFFVDLLILFEHLL